MNNVILLHMLADDRHRERLADAERRYLICEIAATQRTPRAGRARRTVGRILIRVGQWLGGEERGKAVHGPLPPDMRTVAR